MAKKGNFYQKDGTPNEDFDEVSTEELTTEEARELLEEQDVEQKRAVDRRRRAGVNVQDARRADRSHSTPKREAERARTPKRENPVAWKPAATLDAPPAPPGMVIRWVRAKLGDKDDPRNISKKTREGWKPYLVKDAPADYTPPETAVTRIGEVIAVGDLILCMMPKELYKSRTAFYRAKAKRQKQAVADQARAQVDPRLPLEVVNQDTFSRGKRRPNVQGDEAEYGEG